jgi:hypothetical protein
MKELKGIDENTPIKFYEFTKIIGSPRERIKKGDLVDVRPNFKKGNVIDITHDNGILVRTDNGYCNYPICELLFISRAEKEPEIPAKWCVRRTPENAEVLQAWRKATFYDKQYWSKYVNTDANYLHSGSGIVWDSVREGFTEITFEKWQTIPEVSEWLKENVKDINFFGTGIILKGIKPTEKVEEREIIGWKMKDPNNHAIGLACKRIWATEIKHIEIIHESSLAKQLQKLGVLELWFEPVYREEPKFNVGDWVIPKEGNHKAVKIIKIAGKDMYEVDEKNHGKSYFTHDFCRLATHEEIEVAQPIKSKYMKQRWCVIERGINGDEYTRFDTKEQAHSWILKNADEKHEYEIRPFEVVAYE